MKLGIITCSEAINYGTMLQAMALQKKIEDYGVDAEIVDYRFLEEGIKSYSPFAVKHFKSKVASILFYFIRRKKALAFNTFKTQVMKMSPKTLYYADELGLNSLSKTYDSFCIGSDQVWNPKFKSMNGFLLEFLPEHIYRFSYASSIGVQSIDEEYKIRLKKALSKFAYISVREKGAQKLIKSILDSDVELVLDPTLLLTSDEWMKYEQKVSVKQNYILVYMMSHSSSIIRFAMKKAKEKSSMIYLLSDRLYIGKGIKNLLGISPQQFLYLYRNADCIITNSFHGTAFAINFQKEFWVEYPCKEDDRLGTILSLLELDSRRIEIEYPAPIDFNRVNELLRIYRKNSIDYLESALRNGKKH